MGGVEGRDESAALGAGHGPEVVHRVAGGAAERVVALRDGDGVVVLDAVGLVERAVGLVDRLEAEALRRIEEVEVGLLHVELARRVVDVVAVGRPAGPVAARNHPFADVEVLGVELFVEDDLGRAGPVVLAERDVAGVLGADQRRACGVARRGRLVPGELRVGERRDRELRAAGQVEAVGLAGEGAGAAVADLEGPAVARGGEVAAEEDERELGVAGVAVVGSALGELQEAEARELHAEFADVEDLVVALGGREGDAEVHGAKSTTSALSRATAQLRIVFPCPSGFRSARLPVPSPFARSSVFRSPQPWFPFRKTKRFPRPNDATFSSSAAGRLGSPPPHASGPRAWRTCWSSPRACGAELRSTPAATSRPTTSSASAATARTRRRPWRAPTSRAAPCTATSRSSRPRCPRGAFRTSATSASRFPTTPSGNTPATGPTTTPPAAPRASVPTPRARCACASSTSAACAESASPRASWRWRCSRSRTPATRPAPRAAPARWRWRQAGTRDPCPFKPSSPATPSSPSAAPAASTPAASIPPATRAASA